MTKTILLIDGDLFAYKAAAVVEKAVCFDGDNCFPVASLEEAIQSFNRTIRSLCQKLCGSFETTQYVVALTAPTNFRHNIYPDYKSNRKGKPRPVCLPELRAYIRETCQVFERPTLEADDILGILATSQKILPASTQKIIVSVDKDMRSIPGQFYNAANGTTYTSTEQDADRWHMLQTLIGDSADGYPGCPGIGPKKAEALLDGKSGYAEMWPPVVAAYEKAGLTEAEALVQARIARICRVSDYDFKNKEVKLWIPNA